MNKDTWIWLHFALFYRVTLETKATTTKKIPKLLGGHLFHSSSSPFCDEDNERQISDNTQHVLQYTGRCHHNWQSLHDRAGQLLFIYLYYTNIYNLPSIQQMENTGSWGQSTDEHGAVTILEICESI